jgi:hypothetical protein
MYLACARRARWVSCVVHFGGRSDLDTAWGVCSGCGSEDRLDSRTGLCPACAGRAPPSLTGPVAPVQAPGLTTPTGQGNFPQVFPGAYPTPQQAPYPAPYPTAYTAPYPSAYPAPYPAPYAAPYPYQYPYQYPYAYPAPYYGAPPRQSEADSTATLGVVLGFIGLMIVFPFGFVSIVLGAIGMLLSWSGHNRGARLGMWGIILGVLVIVLGAICTVLIFTIPPIW